MRPRGTGVVHALTLGRLVIMVALWKSVAIGPWPTAGWLTAFVLADIADGMVARAFGLDSLRRRWIDAAIDRLAIHSTYAVALWTHPQYLNWYWPLLARDLILITGYYLLVRPRGYFVSGTGWHKVNGLSLAALGLAVAAGATEVVAWLAIWSIGLGYILAADLACTYWQSRRARPGAIIRTGGFTGLQIWLRRGG